MLRAVIRTAYTSGATTTLAALRLGEVLQTLGARVQLRVLGHRKNSVHRYWDIRSYMNSDELTGADLEVWMTAPTRQQWDQVRTQGTKRVIVDVPKETRDLNVYSEADRLISPNLCSCWQLKSVGLSPEQIIWDTAGVPIQCPPIGQVTLVIERDHLESVSDRFIDNWTSLDGLGFSLAVLRPPINDSRSRHIVRRLRGRSCVYANRADSHEYRQVIAQSDLCVLPNRSDVFAYTMLDANLCGVPVVTWDIQPFRGLCHFPTSLAFTSVEERVGRQHAIGRGELLFDKIRDQLKYHHNLLSVRGPLQDIAERRRHDFFTYWQKVLHEI